MERSLLLTGTKITTKATRILIVLMIAMLSMGIAQKTSAQCSIEQTVPCPTGPITDCADETVGGLTGSTITWTPPNFELNCGGTTGGYDWIMQFLLPESQENCWIYNKVQRIGTSGGRLRLNQSTGSGLPSFVTPAFLFTAATDGAVDVLANQSFTMRVFYADATGAHGTTPAATVSVTASGTVQHILFNLAAPTSPDYYRLFFDFNGLTNNQSYIDNLMIDALVSGASCTGDIDFYTTVSVTPALPVSSVINPTGTFFPTGSYTVTYTAYYNNNGSISNQSCSFNVIVNSVSASAVTSPAGCGLNNGSIVLTASSIPAAASLQYSLNSGAWTTFTSPLSILNLPSGVYSINVRGNFTPGGTCNIITPLSATVGIDIDNTDPSVTCPATLNLTGCDVSAITVANSGLAYSSSLVSITAAQFAAAGATATDACGVVTYSYQDSQTGTCPVVVTRTFTATDNSGNSGSCSQTINITPPALVVNKPLDATNSSCSFANQAAVDAAFTTWLTGFSYSGGCSPSGSYGTVSAPLICGGATTVTYNVNDVCGTVTKTATYTVTAPPALSITSPSSSTTSACIYANQAEVDAAFNTWLGVFSVSGGCSPSGSFVGTPAAPALCGGTTSVTYNYTDKCESGTRTASFTITPPAALTVNSPANSTTSSCTYANQAAVDAAFATWLSGFNVSGGCAPSGSFVGTPAAPALCGGATSVTYNYTDKCGNGTRSATFTVTAPTALTINKPANSTTSSCTYADQAAVNAAFATWLTGFSVTGGCNPLGTFSATPVAPALCGGTVTVTYNVTDLCGSGSQSATFTITAPTTLTINKPANSTTSSCTYADQAAVNAAFATWLTGFNVSGGCSPVGAFGSTPVAPALCGGTVTVTYNVTDLCGSGSQSATFTITAPTALTVNSPANSTTSSCAYANQAAVNTAFATWLSGFNVSGGCAPSGSFVGTPAAPALCGGSTSVTYNYTDKCESGTRSATFTITAPTALTINKPVNSTTSSCAYADQAAVNAAFATWLTGFSVSGGCSPVGTFGSTPVAPALCGGTVTVTYNVTDLCGSGSQSATFTITAPTALTVNSPANSTTSSCAYANQAAVNTAFATWLSGFNVSGGCAPSGSFVGTPAAPDLCGGSTSVTYNYTDKCESGTRSATFTITAPTALTINKPVNSTTSSCAYADQAAVNAAFATWLTGFSVSGGCSPVGTFGSTPVAPALCGGTVTVTYNVTDLCGSGSQSATFTITAPTALTVNSPGNSTTSSCAYANQAAVNTAFATWLSGFNVSGGCAPSGSFVGTPVAPDLCGGSTSVTYNYTDKCESGTRSATFTITAPTALTINKPANSTTSSCAYADQAAVNAAFATWLTGFSVSGGCSPDGTFGSTPVAPALCGGTVTVTYNVTDLCGSGSQSATFTITAPSALTVNSPANSTTSSCAYANQAAVNTAFATWLSGFNVSGGCAPSGSFVGTPAAPALCGGSTSVTYNYTDKCESGTRSATFTITAPTALTINKPANSTTSSCTYADQAALNAAFATWLTGFSVSGGCSPVGTFGSTPVAPALCGGTVTVTYNVTDLCGSGSQSATFTITAPTALTINKPANSTTSSCTYADQAAVNSAFTTWLTGFSVSGGCSPQGNYGTPVAPSLCGGSVTVTYNVTDLCGSGSQTATFTITAPPAIVIASPADLNIAGCGTTAITGLPFSTTLVNITAAQFASDGGTVTSGCYLTSYSYIDVQTGSCPITVTRTFTVNGRCGLSDSDDQIIQIDDNTAPTWVTPAGELDAALECGDEAGLAAAMSMLPVATDNCSAVTVTELPQTDCLGNDQEGSINAGLGNYFPFTVTGFDNLSASDIGSLSLHFETNQGKGRAEFTLVSPSGQGIILVGPYCSTGYCNDPDPSNQELYTPTFYPDASGYPQWDNYASQPQGPGNYTPYGGLTSPNAGTITGLTQGYVSSFEELTGPMNGTWFVFARKQATVNGSIDFNSICMTPSSCVNDEVIIRSWIATDGCNNNSDTYTQVIAITDNTPPVITLPSANLSLECYNAAAVNAWIATASATDDCQGTVAVTSNYTPPASGCDQSITVTFTAVDNCGNTATATKAFTVDDNTPPVIATEPVDITVSCINDVPAMISLAWTDNCDSGGTILGTDGPLVGGPCEGTITRTWAVTDACGNPATPRVQIITIEREDFIMPANAGTTVACPSMVTTPVPPVVNDNCGNPITPTGPVVGGTYTTCEGTITYTYTYTDCELNTHYWVYTYTIERLPFANPIDEGTTVACASLALQPSASQLPLVTDNCGNVLTPAAPVLGGTFAGCEGTITYTYVYTDCEGNIQDWVYTYTVELEDLVLPPNDGSTVACPSMATIPVPPVVYDNCDLPIIPSGPVTGGTYLSTLCEGTITYTWTYPACEGTNHDWVYTYTIERETFPEVAPTFATVDCPADVAPPAVMPVVVDNCGTVLSPSAPVISTIPTCEGIVTYTYTYTDCEGNSRQYVHTVTIEYETFPTITPTFVTVDCPADVAPPSVMPIVVDNCGVTLTPSAPVISTIPTCEGIVTYTYTYTDCEGNSRQYVHTVTIEYETFPTITPTFTTVDCPADVVPPAIMPVVVDNCGVTLSPSAPVISTIPTCEGVVTYTYTYTDCENNSRQYVHTVTIEYETFPTITPTFATVDCPADVAPPAIMPVVVDNCGVTLTPSAPVISTIPTCEGIVTYTYTYTDCENNSRQYVHTVTIEYEPFANPIDESTTVACASLAVQPSLSELPVVHDNCGNILTPSAPVIGNNIVGCEGTITYTYLYTDCEGNTQDWVYTYYVEAEELVLPPNDGSIIACPSMATIPSPPVVYDNCDLPIIPSGPITGGTYTICEGTITYTWTYPSCEGTNNEWVYTYTIEREPFPTIAPTYATVDCPADVAPPSVMPTVVDNCGVVLSPSAPVISTIPTCEGSVTYTYTYTDCEGNSQEYVHTVTIEYEPFPTITPTFATVDCPAEVAPPAVMPVVVDNCGVTLTPSAPVISTIPTCEGIVTYTYTYTDCENNSRQYVHTVTIEYETFPTIAPTFATVDCPAEVAPPAVLPVVVDNCGVTLNPSGPVISTIPTCEGLVTYTYTYTDCENNTRQYVHTVTIEYETFPAITPTFATVDCPAEVAPPAVMPVVVDNCGVVLTPSAPVISTIPTCEGIVTYTYTYTDCENNSRQYVHTVTIEYETFPTIAPTFATVDCPAEVAPPAVMPVVVDNCGTVLSPSAPVISTIPTCEGIVTYTYTYTDCEGNSRQYVHTVTIEYETFPTIAPTFATVDCPAEVAPPAVMPVVVDNCGVVLTPSAPVISTIPTCEGIVTYTYTYTDCEGNSRQYVHTVTIEYETFPTITPTFATVDCPAEVAPPAVMPVVVDNCGTVLSPSAPVISTIPTCEGVVTYTYTYTDCEGNSRQYVHTVTIEYETFPTITPTFVTVDCPADVAPPSVMPIVVDNCGVTLTPSAPVISTIPTCEGIVTYTYTYTDCENNSRQYVHTVTIEYEPFANPIDDGTTVACASLALPPVGELPLVVDNCGNLLTPAAPVIGGTFAGCEGTITYTYLYTDCEGNTQDWVYTYTVELEEIVLPPNDGCTIACPSMATIPVPPVVYDNCGLPIVPSGPVTGGTYTTCEGTITYTWTYPSCEGTNNEWVYTYTIEREPFPTIAPTYATVDCPADVAPPVVMPTVVDNCGVVLSPSAPVISTIPTCEGSVTYTYTYTDCEGNSQDYVHTVTIEYEPFATIAPTSATVTCINDIVLPTLPVVTDNCGNTLTPTGPVVSPMPLECEPGQITYTWTYTDCEGNSQQYIHTVNIEFGILSILPTYDTVACINDIVVPDPPVVYDNCGNVLSYTGPVISPDPLPGCEGQVIYNWTYIYCEEATIGYTHTVTIEYEPFADPQDAGSVITCSDQAVAPTYLPTVTDNCGNILTPTGPVIGGNNEQCNGTVTYTYVYTDCEGNTQDWVYTYTIIDNIPPVVYAPAPLQIMCDLQNDPDAIIAEWLASVTATDNCDPDPLITNNYTGYIQQCNAATTVTFYAVDNCNNQAVPVTSTITYIDNTPPSVTVENLTVECDGTGNAVELENWLNSAIVFDNCDSNPVVSNNYSSLSDGCGLTGTTTVTWFATDDCNNTGTASATFTIVDTQGPSINEPNDITTNNDPGYCGAQVNIPVATASDLCSAGVTVTNNITGTNNASGYYEVGTTTITWTAVDECGNTSTEQTIVTVIDNEAPIIICPPHMTVNTDPNTCGAFVNVPLPNVSDNCEIREVTNTYTHTGDASAVYPVGTTIVWWTVVDMAGNTDNCFMNVTVVDEQDPTIICPENIITSNDPGLCEANVTVPEPEVSDNCEVISVVNTYTGTSNASGVYPVGTTTVTWTVTDASGNTATCTMTVTVNDTETPIIICPENIAVNTDPGVCGANVTVPQPEVSDNCDVNELSNDFNNTPNATGFYPVGTTTITWTVTDIHGNEATCQMTVTVTDTENPTIICPTDITVGTDPGVCGAEVEVPAPEAADNCGVALISNDFTGTGNASGSYPVGTTTVVWTVTDLHGNVATCQMTVTVTDDEAPAVTCPGDVTAVAGVDCQATVEIPEPEVSDNCEGVTYINDFTNTGNASGVYPVGVTTVTWTVTDSHGNTSTCSITVTVSAPPVAVDDAATTDINTAVIIDVLANDTDCADGLVPSTVTNTTDPSNGTVVVNPADGSFTYTPNADFTGTDTFTYSVCNEQGLCDEAVVTITISGAPVVKLIAVDDEYSTEFNQPREVANLDNDIYPETVTPVVTILDQPLHGTITVHGDMTATYTPNDDYSGTDTYTYILSDMNDVAVADTAVTTITIVPAPERDTIIIWNVITPDNDGHNDRWVIDNIEEYPDNEILIFNRWGDQIRYFEHYDNTTVVWDGTNKDGDKLPAATYYYIIKLRELKKVYTGWVVIHAHN